MYILAFSNIASVYQFPGDVHDQMRTKSQGLALSLTVRVALAVEAKVKRGPTKKGGKV